MQPATMPQKKHCLGRGQGFNLKVVNAYDNAKDPAEIILENRKLQEAVKNARGIMDYYFDTAFLHFDKNTQQGRLAMKI
jgi:hypothetical protein